MDRAILIILQKKEKETIGKHSYLGKGVSDFLFMSLFYFNSKKKGNFGKYLNYF